LSRKALGANSMGQNKYESNLTLDKKLKLIAPNNLFSAKGVIDN
jgi:hypothetical protein